MNTIRIQTKVAYLLKIQKFENCSVIKIMRISDYSPESSVEDDEE